MKTTTSVDTNDAGESVVSGYMARTLALRLRVTEAGEIVTGVSWCLPCETVAVVIRLYAECLAKAREINGTQAEASRASDKADIRMRQVLTGDTLVAGYAEQVLEILLRVTGEGNIVLDASAKLPCDNPGPMIDVYAACLARAQAVSNTMREEKEVSDGL